MNQEPIKSRSGRYRLPVTKVLVGALFVIWANRVKMLQALLPTAILIAAIQTTWDLTNMKMGNPLAILFVAPLLMLFAKFSVITHRLVLVDFDSGNRWISPLSWSNRESYFMLRMILVLAIILIGSFIISLVPLTLVRQSMTAAQQANPEALFPFSVLFAGIPALYLLARLILMFPATSLDQETGVDRAWNMSRGNGLKMLVIVGPVPWLGVLLQYLFYWSLPVLLADILSEITRFIFLTIELTALSLAYRELVQHGQDKTGAG